MLRLPPASIDIVELPSISTAPEASMSNAAEFKSTFWPVPSNNN
jgi:hypothetical protein